MTTPERRAVLLLGHLPHTIGRAVRFAGPFLLFALLLALFLPLGFAPAASAAQKPYALVYVNVFTADGHVAYGVPIKIRRADKKKPLQDGLSDHSGEIAFRVPPGPADYIVWADLKQPKKKPADPVGVNSQPDDGLEVKVHVAGDERVDVPLHLPQSVKPY